MIKNISDILVKGEFFSDEVRWNFASNNPKNDDRLFLIFGENGSGKTTFSKAIFEYKVYNDGELKNFDYVKFCDCNGNVLNIDKKAIWSFNDEFIQSNVRIKDSGLNAIVMFGEAGDIDQQIQEKNTITNAKKAELLSINLEKYTTAKSPECIDDIESLMINTLKDSWAIKDKEIKGNSRNSSVTETVLKNVINCKKTEKTLSSLENEFSELLKTYLSLPKNAEVINFRLKEDYMFTSDETIHSLLTKELNKPILGELEEKIMKQINNEDRIVSINDTNQLILSTNEICPLCYQPLSNEHKQNIISAINSIFNDEAQILLDQLNKIEIAEISSEDFAIYSTAIDTELKMKINNAIQKINNIVGKYKIKIEEKKSNVFSALKCDNLSLDYAVQDLISLIKKGNESIERYNKNINSVKEIKNTLDLLNMQISYLKIKPFHTQLDSLVKHQKEDNDKFNLLTNEIKELENEISALNAKKLNLDIGLKEINNDLMTICHTKKKLSLVLDNGQYFVESKGRRVKFKNLSVGEKNIIGLCYFFSLIRQNHRKKDVFKEDILVVLDDPVSSFDYNNKYGIFSYLKKMIGDIFNGNLESKVIILTHELEVMDVLDKIRADYSFTKKNFKLEGKNLNHFNFESNYSQMIKNAIDIAQSAGAVSSEMINTTRRILEAFCVFNYKESINEFSRDKEVLSTIKDENLRNYLEA